MSQIIVTATETFGPFSTVETLEDRYRCDGDLDLPFAVIGAATVQDADGFVLPTPGPNKEEIQGKIIQLEHDSMMNRGVRETMLRLYEDRAPAIAAQNGITPEQVLAAVPAYVQFKALDDKIVALRAQL